MSKVHIIKIALVNDEDDIIGFDEKIKVHREGLLHRAFSILIYNAKGQMLIHQRAFGKYHSPGLWTNACCGHPNEGEETPKAAQRRLMEEMGFQCDLEFQFKFRYFAAFDNGLKEHEIDHVFVGEYNNTFTVNPEEVADYKWLDIDEIKLLIEEKPEEFTVWFQEIMKHL